MQWSSNSARPISKRRLIRWHILYIFEFQTFIHYTCSISLTIYTRPVKLGHVNTWLKEKCLIWLVLYRDSLSKNVYFLKMLWAFSILKLYDSVVRYRLKILVIFTESLDIHPCISWCFHVSSWEVVYDSLINKSANQ